MTTDLAPLALISGPKNVGDNWRVIRPFARLCQMGIDAQWFGLDTPDGMHIPTDPERTVLVVRLLTGDDERAIDRWMAERRPKVRAIVYECDDVFYGPEMVEHLEASNFMQGKSGADLIHQGEMAKYLARQCDGIITASEPLAEMIRRDMDRPVITVPNAIDQRWFRAQMAYKAPWQRDGRVTIGWLGGHRPEADVAPMAVAWGRIARRYPQVRFVVAAPVVPDVFYREIEDDSLIFRYGWTPWEECPVLFQVDVGCAAVTPTPFSLCKTSIKLWEYTVAGAAVVVTPTLYGDCARAGQASLAETTEDWEWALAQLIESDVLRAIQAGQTLDHVEQHHSLDTQLHRWETAFEDIVKAREGVAV